MDEDEDRSEAEDTREAGESVVPPAPRENAFLVGHETAEKTLLRAIEGNRLPHGLLITGPYGIGKASLAYRLARFLFAHSVARGDLLGPLLASNSLAISADHRVFRQVASGGHADLMTVERAFDAKRNRLRSEIVVDDTRAISGFLHLTPAEGGWRIVIVDTADEMNRNAANALLKILEEPPARALIILISNHLGRILPTIKSRCRILRLQPLPQATIAALLTRYNPGISELERDSLVGLANGSIGRALELARQGGVKLYRDLQVLMAGLPSVDSAALNHFAERIARPANEGDYLLIRELLPQMLAAQIASAARGVSDETIAQGGGLSIAIRERGLDRFAELWEKITYLFAQADAINLDRKLAVLNVFFALEEAAS